MFPDYDCAQKKEEDKMTATLKSVMFLLLSYGIVIWGGGSFVRKILRRVKKLESKEEGAGEENGAKGCGRYTGYMERFMVFTAFYLRQQTGAVMLLLVVFLLLAKLITLWDYRRSGGKRLSEHYLVGSLSSFTFALVCAFLLTLILPQARHGH